MKSPIKNVRMVLKKFIEHTFQFLVGALLHMINYILSLWINVYSDYMKPAVCQYYV
jgi:hypothetical protein